MLEALSLAAVVAGGLLAAVPAGGQAARPQPSHPVAIEVGARAPGRGGLLPSLLPIGDADRAAAEDGLVSDLEKRPWLGIVRQDGEAAVAISRGHRWQDSRSHSKNRKTVSIAYRYKVEGVVAIEGERGDIEAEVTVTRSYSTSHGRQEPTDGEDRRAFEDAGRALGAKAREWLLPRVARLRPAGPAAGFSHKARFKWLLKGDGLEVTAVVAGSPADRAGLLAGDRIRTIDGEAGTKEMDERAWTWYLEAPGTPVTLEVERNGQRRSVSFSLGSGPTSRQPPPPTRRSPTGL